MAKKPASLKKQVADREKMLQEILDFAQSVVLKHGKVTNYEEGACVTKIVRELRDFNNLDVVWRLGHSHHIEISYGITQDFRALVFSMTYWHDGIKGCEVSVLSSEKAWQRAFRYAAKHAEAIVAKKKLAKSETTKKDEADSRQKQDVAALHRRAEKLGLR